MRVLGSKVAVAFTRAPEKLGTLYIPDGLKDGLRANVGTVLAHGPCELWARGKAWPFPAKGTRVLAHSEDGTQIENPEGVDCEQLRVYGSWGEFQSEVQDCPWWVSILAGFENMSWKAYGDNVLIEPDPQQDRVGSILLPDVAKRRVAMGTVRSCGPLVDGLAAGDRVCYDPHKCHLLTPAESEELGGLIPANVLAIAYVSEAA